MAILSHAVWKRLFNADPQIVGKSITLNGNAYTVVGVLGPEFRLNHEVMPTVGATDGRISSCRCHWAPTRSNRRGDENYNVMVRLKPGVSVSQAQADIDIIAGRIREKDKRDRTFGMTRRAACSTRWWAMCAAPVLVLLGSVGAGAVDRLRERREPAAHAGRRAARRKSPSARRWAQRWQRFVRQLLTESILLALMGGAAGLLIAQWSLYIVAHHQSRQHSAPGGDRDRRRRAGIYVRHLDRHRYPVRRGAGAARREGGSEHFAEIRRAKLAERRRL